jgi:hypothetical protein
MLMHGMMIFSFVYTTRHAIHVEEYHFMYAALAHLIVCMLVGLFISLLWDYPISMGVHRLVMCRSRLAWIRAGRHSRKRLAELEQEFFPSASDHLEKTNGVLAQSGGIFIIPNAPIPNCNYVAASPGDFAILGLSEYAAPDRSSLGSDRDSEEGKKQDEEKIGYSELYPTLEDMQEELNKKTGL